MDPVSSIDPPTTVDQPIIFDFSKLKKSKHLFFGTSFIIKEKSGHNYLKITSSLEKSLSFKSTSEKRPLTEKDAVEILKQLPSAIPERDKLIDTCTNILFTSKHKISDLGFSPEIIDSATKKAAELLNNFKAPLLASSILSYRDEVKNSNPLSRIHELHNYGFNLISKGFDEPAFLNHLFSVINKDQVIREIEVPNLLGRISDLYDTKGRQLGQMLLSSTIPSPELYREVLLKKTYIIQTFNERKNSHPDLKEKSKEDILHILLENAHSDQETLELLLDSSNVVGKLFFEDCVKKDTTCDIFFFKDYVQFANDYKKISYTKENITLPNPEHTIISSATEIYKNHIDLSQREDHSKINVYDRAKKRLKEAIESNNPKTTKEAMDNIVTLVLKDANNNFQSF